jgi:hypothetical protein
VNLKWFIKCGGFKGHLEENHALNAQKRMSESACKPGSVVDSHSSGTCITAGLKQPTRIQCEQHHWIPIWPCSERGLPCHDCYQSRGALLPHPFTLTCCVGTLRFFAGRRSALCCTFRRLSPPRRYLAFCSMEPGLSSDSGLTNRLSDKRSVQNSDCPADSAPRLRELRTVYKHFVVPRAVTACPHKLRQLTL